MLVRLDIGPFEDRSMPTRETTVLTDHLAPATVRLWTAFSGLEPEVRRHALTLGVVQPALPGDRLSSEGQLMVVVSGCLTLDAPGSALTAQIARPGDLVSSGIEHAITGRWLSCGEVYRAPAIPWLEAAGPPGLRYALAASERARTGLMRRVTCALTHDAKRRLADLLVAIHEATGRAVLEMSQARLAEMLGLQRTTANSVCRDFERDSVIRTVRGRIHILDAAGLADLACGCRIRTVDGSPS